MKERRKGGEREGEKEGKNINSFFVYEVLSVYIYLYILFFLLLDVYELLTVYNKEL